MFVRVRNDGSLAEEQAQPRGSKGQPVVHLVDSAALNVYRSQLQGLAAQSPLRELEPRSGLDFSSKDYWTCRFEAPPRCSGGSARKRHTHWRRWDRDYFEATLPSTRNSRPRRRVFSFGSLAVLRRRLYRQLRGAVNSPPKGRFHRAGCACPCKLARRHTRRPGRSHSRAPQRRGGVRGRDN